METVEQALVDLAAGRPVVVVGGGGREGEGDLVVAADRITAATMAFVVRHTSGYVCVALPEQECVRLALPAAHHSASDGFGTAHRVSVDAAQGIGTGISARDRAHSARLLAAPSTRPDELTRPGHLVPLAARPDGVLGRAGHPEAAVDLTRLAGMRPAGVLCGLVSPREPGRMARRAELVDFAAEHGLTVVTVEDLIDHRRVTETVVERLATVALPVDGGAGRLVGYRDATTGAEHVALLFGECRGADVPVHVHAECVLGDVFGSRACRCASRLADALHEITAARGGVIVYVRPGTALPLVVGDRGDSPCGTPDPLVVAAILTDLGVASVSHLSNPPSVRDALDAVLGAAPAERHPAGAVA